jgi:hypothetical protein
MWRSNTFDGISIDECSRGLYSIDETFQVARIDEVVSIEKDFRTLSGCCSDRSDTVKLRKHPVGSSESHVSVSVVLRNK